MISKGLRFTDFGGGFRNSLGTADPNSSLKKVAFPQTARFSITGLVKRRWRRILLGA